MFLLQKCGERPAQAGSPPERNGNIECQIDIRSHEAVGSFFHAKIIAQPRLSRLTRIKPQRCYTVWMNSKPAMRFKRALTKGDLKAIQQRNPDSSDVRVLLWEVARLRALALRTHDYFRQGSSSTALILADSLRTMIEDEPVVKEQAKL